MVVYLLLRRKVRLRMQGGTVFFAGWFRRGESQVRDTEMSGEMSGLKSAKIYL
jgi:hypothetical protein